MTKAVAQLYLSSRNIMHRPNIYLNRRMNIGKEVINIWTGKIHILNRPKKYLSDGQVVWPAAPCCCHAPGDKISFIGWKNILHRPNRYLNRRINIWREEINIRTGQIYILNRPKKYWSDSGGLARCTMLEATRMKAQSRTSGLIYIYGSGWTWLILGQYKQKLILT